MGGEGEHLPPSHPPPLGGCPYHFDYDYVMVESVGLILYIAPLHIDNIMMYTQELLLINVTFRGPIYLGAAPGG